jgi:hypothetical protein
MGMFDKIIGKKKSTHVVITAIGKAKAEASSSGLRFSILSHLEDNGASSYTELADATGRDIHKIRVICKQMLHEGEIKENIGGDDN